MIYFLGGVVVGFLIGWFWTWIIVLTNQRKKLEALERRCGQVVVRDSIPMSIVKRAWQDTLRSFGV